MALDITIVQPVEQSIDPETLVESVGVVGTYDPDGKEVLLSANITFLDAYSLPQTVSGLHILGDREGWWFCTFPSPVFTGQYVFSATIRVKGKDGNSVPRRILIQTLRRQPNGNLMNVPLPKQPQKDPSDHRHVVDVDVSITRTEPPWDRSGGPMGDPNHTVHVPNGQPLKIFGSYGSKPPDPQDTGVTGWTIPATRNPVTINKHPDNSHPEKSTWDCTIDDLNENDITIFTVKASLEGKDKAASLTIITSAGQAKSSRARPK
jgi:hypothetical protein